MFDVVINTWGFLDTSHDPTTDNESLANKTYFCLGLLANLEDLLIPVDARSIILGILDPVLYSEYHSSTLRYVIQMSALDDF